MQRKEISVLEHSLYAELYRRYAPRLFAYAYQQTTSREDAEDIVLDVFLSVLENQRFPTFDEKRQEAWSPDSHMLASSTNEFGRKSYALNTVISGSFSDR